NQALGPGPNHHLVRSGEDLKTGGEIWRLADHRLLLCRTLADEIAHHHLSGGNGNSASEHFTLWRALLSHRLDHGQAGPDRLLSLVLMRTRPAEIDEYAIAHVLGDEAIVATDGIGHTEVIGADHIAQVLRIKPRRQQRRADQITEHHRELASLGL